MMRYERQFEWSPTCVACHEKTCSLQYSDNQYKCICRFLRYKNSFVWTDFLIFFGISQAWPKGLKTLVPHLSQWWWLQLVLSSHSFLSWALQMQVFSTTVKYFREPICQKNNWGKKQRALEPVLISPHIQFKQTLLHIPVFLAACSSQFFQIHL